MWIVVLGLLLSILTRDLLGLPRISEACLLITISAYIVFYVRLVQIRNGLRDERRREVEGERSSS